MDLTGRPVHVPAYVFGDPFVGDIVQVRGGVWVDVFFAQDQSMCSFTISQVREWLAECEGGGSGLRASKARGPRKSIRKVASVRGRHRGSVTGEIAHTETLPKVVLRMVG